MKRHDIPTIDVVETMPDLRQGQADVEVMVIE
jgi:hypothetical protein